VALPSGVKLRITGAVDEAALPLCVVGAVALS
jgi:hypothetical protein